jgi:hypothetical protein
VDEEAVRGYLPPRAEGGDAPTPQPGPRPRPPRPPLSQASFVQPEHGQTNGTAVAAFILGISGLGLTVLFAGWLFFIALPCSVLAWVFGVQGKRKVDRGEVAVQRGMAKTGQILGIVGVILGILLIVFWVVLFFGYGVEIDELEEQLGQPASWIARR